MPNSLENKPIDLKRRPYQKQAVSVLMNHVKDLLNGTLEIKEEDICMYVKAFLLEMATGSGKTFTIGKTLEQVIRLRNMYLKEKMEGLSILVLSDRIDGVEQFRDDLVHGRLGKDLELKNNPILSKRILDNLTVHTFHSKTDDINRLDGKVTESEEEEIENFSGNKNNQKDNIYFSTDKTANSKEIYEKIPYIDIIIIDEAHNVKDETDGEAQNNFGELIDKLAVKSRNGNEPWIVPLTATPTNITTELFGKPKFSYPLAEYLASEYSPSVDYQLISSSTASKEEIDSIGLIIENIKKIKDHKEKKELLKEVEKKLEKALSSCESIDELVEDMLTRIMKDNGKLNETVVFVNNIEEADEVANLINEKTNDNIALSYHSKNDRNKALDRLRDRNDPIKMIVVIGKVDESIDLPVVSNIVFWKGTNIAQKFLQKFGRGLRGLGLVRYYDYVGGIKNFGWIGNIYEEYKKYKEKNNTNKKEDKFKIISGSSFGTNLTSHNLNLSFLGIEVNKLKSSFKLEDLEDYVDYFKENIEEFKDFGIKFIEDDIIDLNNIGNPAKYYLFGLKSAEISLKWLNKILGNKDKGRIQKKEDAQKILKQFFVKIGYEVILEEKKEKVKLENLEDYEKYVEDNNNLKELEDYGIKFIGEKKVGLDGVESPTIKGNYLFGELAMTGLKKLNIVLGNEDNGRIQNKEDAQKILKQFFKKIKYEVILEEKKEKVKLENLEDYERYVEDNNNLRELEDYGIKFIGEKEVNLDKIGNPNKYKIFQLWGSSSLKNLNKILLNKDEGQVKTILIAKKILTHFFKKIKYKVTKKKK